MAEANAFVDFKTVKEQIPITEVLKRYGLAEALKKSGRQLIGQCPFHQGHIGTFKVDPEKGTWYCFKCEEGGDTLALVARLEGCDIREAALKLVDWFNLNPGTPPDHPEAASNSEGVPAPVIMENSLLPFELDLEPDHPWFGRNGITAEAIAHFGLGYCASSRVIRHRIGIPIHNAAGDLVAYAGLAHQHTQKPRVAYPDRFNRELELYNLHRAISAEQPGLVIVPGYVDAWRLWQAGKRNVVALMGWQLSEQQLKLLSEHFPSSKMAVKVRWSAEYTDPLPDLVHQLASRFFVHFEIL